MQGSVIKPIALATLVCGSLDILFASVLTLARGKDPAAMLRFVASGPFPAATGWGATGSILGLIVHFTLMGIMVSVFVIVARGRRHWLNMPVRAAVAYGVVTYVALDLIVVPLRFRAAWPPTTLSIVTQLFAHIVLVGLPTALIARHYWRSEVRFARSPGC